MTALSRGPSSEQARHHVVGATAVVTATWLYQRCGWCEPAPECGQPVENLPALRLGGEPLGEEHPVVSVLLRPVGQDVAVPGIVGLVLGHRLVGVEPSLGQTQLPGCRVGESEHAGAD